MKHKVIYILLIISLLACNFSTQLSFADDDAVEAYYSGSPKLVIARNVSIPVFKATGEEIRLVIPIENTGTSPAQNVIVSPVIDDTKNFPFEIDQMTTKKKISSIGRHQKEDAVFYLKVRTSAESKTYPITFKLEYTSLSGSTYSDSDTIYIKIENNQKLPMLQLNKLQMEGNTLYSGKAKTVQFFIENTGDLTAKDVDVRLGGFSSDGLRLENTVDTQSIKLLEPKKIQMVPFKILADPDLESGTYTLDLFFTFKDEYNQSYTKETKVYIPVEGSGSLESNFAFENLVYPHQSVDTNSDFTISFDLKNTGDTDVKCVKVSADGGSDILPKSMSVISVGALASGQSKHFDFVLFAKEGSETKNYPVKINVEYESGSGKNKTTQNISQYAGILVNNTKAQNGSPKLIVDHYQYGGEYVMAGQAFPLELSFWNTNRSHAVRNIKISISSDEGTFSPVDSSNSMFIAEIQPNSSIVRSITLKPKVDSSFKTYNVYADMEYEDGLGNKYTSKEVIGIPIIQEIKLVTGQVEASTENYVGSPTALSLDFYNVGRALIRNLVIRTEGDFEAKDSTQFIGNLEPGKDNYYDASIIPDHAGTLQGKILFEYDDEVGTHYTVEKEFSVEVMEQMEPPMMDPAMEMEQGREGQSGSKKWGMILVGIGILGGFGFILYRKKRKKKAEEVMADE
ncbi:MAG: COG1361 S-layer family protein [Bacillota bacterium]